MEVIETRSLNLRCWEGYETEDFLKPFTQRHQTNVDAQTLLSDLGTAEQCALGSSHRPDILNINNAYVSKFLDPRNAVQYLMDAQLDSLDQTLHDDFRHLAHWAHSTDGKNRIGIVQRFGAFNLVINTDAVSVETARSEGFNLADNQALHHRYGVLLYQDFNIFHICIAADLNPFKVLTPTQIEKFSRTATRWFANAKLVTDDHFVLNKALAGGEIDFYLSGGTYTASPARLAGHLQIRAITPAKGPINGKGGIVFTEVTCLPKVQDPHPLAPEFLRYLVEGDTPYRAAVTQRSLNPVMQMGDPKVFNRFSAAELDAIQWASLGEDIALCAEYDIVPDQDRLLGIYKNALHAFNLSYGENS